MSTTRAALEAARDAGAPVAASPGAPAPLVVTLPPSAFATAWKGRPAEPARIGLRLVSESVIDQARAEATASADRHYVGSTRNAPGYVEHFNGILMRTVLAQALCNADDADASWFRAVADDIIGVAFTERGILRLWQGYMELRERLSPLIRCASAEEVSDLAARLAAADVESIDDGDRRLLARILDDMRAAA